MVRIDMSEYMEKHTVARLIGAPPGYVGYEEGGQLTEAVRRRPYCVILFDEIEKAHHDVFNVMLQILDDGRLTDGQGRTVDFKNTVIIMTSNIGSQLILDYRGGEDADTYERMKAEVLEALRQHFRPEFLNRVDEVVVFHSLTREQLKQIVGIQLQRLRARLADRKIELELTDAALEHFARTGLRPGLRGAAAEAAVAEGAGDRSRPQDHRRRGARQQPGDGRLPRQRSRVHEPAVGRSGVVVNRARESCSGVVGHEHDSRTRLTSLTPPRVGRAGGWRSGRGDRRRRRPPFPATGARARQGDRASRRASAAPSRGCG